MVSLVRASNGRAGEFNPFGMKDNHAFTLRVIAEGLREKYEMAYARMPYPDPGDWQDFYYSCGEAVGKVETFTGEKEKNLERFSWQLQKTFPDARDDQFSIPRLKAMKVFYLAYRGIRDDISWDAVLKLSWQHHIKHLCRIAVPEERYFYLRSAAINDWTCEILCRKIKNNYYAGLGHIISNFDLTLSAELGKLAQSIFQKIYCFEFVKTKEGSTLTEKELEATLIAHIKEFLEEFGPGFAFKYRQCRIRWDGSTYVYDLVLYHTELKCHIVVEVKIGAFKPEYIGKLSCYLDVADKELKVEGDNDTIGIVLCRSANDKKVKSSLDNSRRPIGVATYHIGD